MKFFFWIKSFFKSKDRQEELGKFMYMKAYGITEEMFKAQSLSKDSWRWTFLGEKYREYAKEFYET